MKTPAVVKPAEAPPLMNKSPLVTGWLEKRIFRWRVFLQLFNIISRKDRNVFRVVKGILRVKNKYESIFGEPYLSKVAKISGRYFWRLAAPGFPSKASKIMQTHEVNRFFSGNQRKGLRSLIFCITNQCALNCEHCFEWENLNLGEPLSREEILDIIHKYQDFGTTQIMLSGGEPMMRIKDLIWILQSTKPGTDFWIITSGIGFNSVRARALKNAGLTGVMVSLDHFDKERHNAFRGYDKAFEAAMSAIENANSNEMVTALSLCATKTFTSYQNLIEYMELAKSMGVAFVQILEPRAVGRLRGKDVALSRNQIKLLEDFYLEFNNSRLYAEYPIIQYLGYHQRKAGCFGCGDRFFYINTKGEAQVCPYCSGVVADAKAVSADRMIELLSLKKCHKFQKNTAL